MNQQFLPNTQIEIVRPTPRGAFTHVLFDFDGTISLLRQGWQQIMAPVMEEMICDGGEPTDAIREEVAQYIEDSTGIQTIVQMHQLVEMVRAHGIVPEDQILTPEKYKEIYNDRLMRPVNKRLEKLEDGSLTIEEATVRGSVDFVREIAQRGVTMYIFSGTDRVDVINEAKHLGVAEYFTEIWGAIGSIEDYSKEKVLKELIEDHGLHGSQVLIVGDGPVELRTARANDCVALGVASDEHQGHGWDHVKRERLLNAGADILVPDFQEHDTLLQYLFEPE